MNMRPCGRNLPFMTCFLSDFLDFDRSRPALVQVLFPLLKCLMIRAVDGAGDEIFRVDVLLLNRCQKITDRVEYETALQENFTRGVRR
ncbi:MAG: hypothetical protein IJ523_09550 [Succinivibrionaceae bacterium]|nr:hypothetical protein [Succinivibrionaceae bacterium]